MNESPTDTRIDPMAIRPRRSRRHPIRGVLVAIEAASSRSDGHWVVDAIDVNADGLGLVLPPELRPGDHILLTFRLTEKCDFSRLPAVVLHHDGSSGGIRFGAWPLADRLHLLEYLVDSYESES